MALLRLNSEDRLCLRSASGKRFPDLRFLAVVTFAIGLGITGCRKTTDVNAQTTNPGADPANVNMAPVDSVAALAANTDQAVRAPGSPIPQQDSRVIQSTQQQPLANESQQQADEYVRTGQQEGAPPEAQQQSEQMQEPVQGYPPDMQQPTEDQIDAGQQALEAEQPPPPLPEYEQPEAPAPNYIWTPGYWDYNPAGYYWVPGAWVMAPYPGALWTPGYWIFIGGHHWRWHHGWWGQHIGFYGGINYGCGYTGYGYDGGYWNGNTFFYNRAVNRVNVTRIRNVYNRTVIVNDVTRVSYNGGPGGIAIRPRPAELAALREGRTPAMRAQVENRQFAAQNRAQFYSENRGRPATTAVAHPLAADRGITRPMPGQVKSQIWHPAPGEHVQQIHSSQPQVEFPARPGQNVQQVRPGQLQEQRVQSEVRPAQPVLQAPQPYVQPTQSQARPQSPATRPGYRPSEPNIRPIEPKPQPQPQPQIRRAPQQQIRPVPESSYRPQAQPQARPVPQQQYRQRPQVQPVPQYRPQPQAEYQSHHGPPAQTRPMPQPQQPRQNSQPHGQRDHPHK